MEILSPKHPSTHLPEEKTPRPALRKQDSTPQPSRRASVRISVPPPSDTQPNKDESIPSATSSSLSVKASIWARKLILTLDGGGIRGYSSLLILQRLMHEIEAVEKALEPTALSSAATGRIDRKEIPDDVFAEGKYLPCHYFDYVAGTSTGGLIAIMLGMQGRSVDDCIDMFKKSKDVPLTTEQSDTLDLLLGRDPLLSLPVRRTWPSRRTKSFYERIARFSVTSTAARPVAPPSLPEFKKDIFQCQTLAWCTEVDDRKNTFKPYAFCSYEDYSERSRSVSVEDVAKFITTPWSSKPSKSSLGKFLDGSRQPELRDPTYEVLKELNGLLNRDGPPVDLVLSLGTDDGHHFLYHLVEKLKARKRSILALKDEWPEINYQRFEVTDIRLPTFKKKHILHAIESATRKWLEVPDHLNEIRSHAKLLVQSRRARASTPRWETFALGVRYFCFHDSCSLRDQPFENRGDFFDHLNRTHALMKTHMKAEIEKARRPRKSGSVKSMSHVTPTEVNEGEGSKTTAAKTVDVEAELDKGRRIGYASGLWRL